MDMTQQTVELRRIADVVSRLHYPGLEIKLEHAEHGLCLFVNCPNGVCNVTGEPEAWSGRKWPISLHHTNGDVVNTAFKAVITALEHEAREQFLFQGEAVMQPHRDFDLCRDAVAVGPLAPAGWDVV